MKRRMTAAALVLALICSVLVPLSGCSAGTLSADNLSANIRPQEVFPLSDSRHAAAGAAGFAVRLLQGCAEDGENTLISPLSVLSALGMTVNGAQAETRRQMEQALGLPADTLNDWLYTLRAGLPDEKSCAVHLANSLWMTDHGRFTANRDFLQTNADYYGADLYRLPLNDDACRKINRWVKDRTDGMIPEILDAIPDNAVLYLVNALAFDAAWQTVYTAPHVHDSVFTLEDGTRCDVSLMYSAEYRYLEDDGARGFMKPYEGGKYAFAALLPDAGMSVADYAAALTGARLHALLTAPADEKVIAAIPKFESEWSADLRSVLEQMGMTDAFDPELADLSALGRSEAGNLFISRVLHKTYISVTETGTRAGAAAAVETKDGAAAPDKEPQRVTLDRPFVYMIVDMESGFPIFMGTMMNPGA